MCAWRYSPQLLVLSSLSVCVALDNGLGKRPGLGWNSDYCTNCSGPLHPLYGYAGVRATGYGDEVFVKHIADHMHTVKYKTIGGAQKTLQELGFKYHLRTTNVPIKIMDWLRFTYVLQDRY
jgi:hypothetical protein